MTTDESSINDDAARAGIVEEPATRIAQPHAIPAGTLHSADSLLEGAAEALIRKAISMALSGHAPSLRLVS